MCGIIGYFGSQGNHLTRILTGMSAIIYRAPDSTGVGFFGDDLEPIRTRKAIGSVAHLSESLLDAAAYPNQAENLMSIWNSESDKDMQSQQRRLLEFEGFSDVDLKEPRKYPSFDELTDLTVTKPIRLSPGYPGRPDPLPVFFIRSKKDLKQIIQELTIRYDLSRVVIQSLIRKNLSESLRQESSEANRQHSDILSAFDQLFEKTFSEENLPKATHHSGYEWEQRKTYVQKYLWRYLRNMEIRIPEDYDRDGVRTLFRLLDGALLCRLSNRSDLGSAIQTILKTQWNKDLRGSSQRLEPANQRTPAGLVKNLDWRILYWAEKGANVFGRAASAVLLYLQKMEMFPMLWKDARENAAISRAFIPGETDPLTLRFLSQPIISHGRWALQSPVTLKNSHPFFDANKQRIIVLNGQFNGQTETEARTFLEQIGIRNFRSDNSSEYFSLLWGYYFENLSGEKRRYEAVRHQMEAGLDAYCIGSQTIDYRIYQQIKEKTEEQIDETAFLEAARRMIRGGGQVAVAGLSLCSPRLLYIAAHNRPAFVVHRSDTCDYMVVSDVNAALGLFPQKLIHEKQTELNALKKERRDTSVGSSLRPSVGSSLRLEPTERLEPTSHEKAYQEKENEILSAFKVEVFPLDGEEIFARIETVIENGTLSRRLTITNFDGIPLPEIEPFSLVLSPVHIRKELYGTFYEKHLHEIPNRLNDILQYHLEETSNLPQFSGIRERFLHRRFGKNYSGLKRVFLTGMGSSYHVGLMARKFFQSVMPETDVIVIQPVEIEAISRNIVPEKDLVILISWSSTTADMVEFAKELREKRITMIGMTEKVFADMALITRKSGGVIPVLSGEEVTISGIKSIACMLFSLNLFALWLAEHRSAKDDLSQIREWIEKLREVPQTISQVLADENIKKLSASLSSENIRSHAAMIFGDLYEDGICQEIALKLEENSWTAIGKPMDYQDMFPLVQVSDSPLVQVSDLNQQLLVLVNATCEARLQDALCVMKKLYIAGIPFAAVSYENPEKEEMTRYSQSLTLLPKFDDPLQSFVDLSFYYQFAFQFAQARGRKPDEFPRNRVKSVTAGRSRPKKISTANEFGLLNSEKTLRVFQTLRVSAWEEDASFDWEKIYYRQMRRLGQILCEPDPLRTLPEFIPENWNDVLKVLATIIFEHLPEDGEIIFIPLDRASKAAAENFSRQWSRFLKAPMRVVMPNNKFGTPFSEDAILIYLSSNQNSQFSIPNSQFLIPNSQFSIPRLWFGTELSEDDAQFFKESLGYIAIKQADMAFIESDLLYAGLSLLFIAAWRLKDSDKADILERHFRQTASVILNMLDDLPLKEELFKIMKENQAYQTAFFLSPPGGTGSDWMNIFDQGGPLMLQSHIFGESAHGPLVTVDDQVGKKFVQIQERHQMIATYGEKNVTDWEARYMNGKDMDSFLSSHIHIPAWEQKAGDSRTKRENEETAFPAPFFADGNWYLPLLQEGYDTIEDNLIIMDMTRERHVPQALDELATFGCRYARMILITQEALFSEISELRHHPISHLILLPSLSQEKKIPISDMLLPFAMNLLGMGMASAGAKARNTMLGPISEEFIFQKAFGCLGKIMVRHRMKPRYMNYHLIESLKNIAPLVRQVNGVARYAVKDVESETILQDMAFSNQLYNPEKTLTDFSYFDFFGPAKSRFYLLCPEATAIEAECKVPLQNELWHEPFGNTWKVLNYRIPGIQEGQNHEPLLMIPLIDLIRNKGTLFYLHLSFIEWDHMVSFGEQLGTTIRGLGKEMYFHEYISPRYLKIVSRFNDEMAHRGFVWDDRVLGLIRRSLLFHKPSREIAAILAVRVLMVLNLKRPEDNPVSIEELGVALEKIWTKNQQPAANSLLPEDDETRWKRLYDRLTNFLSRLII